MLKLVKYWGEFFFYRDILISVMKNIPSLLFVRCIFEDWMWKYCNIKVYLKTLMLGGINRD